MRLNPSRAVLSLCLLCFAVATPESRAAGPFQATGFKVGEVTDSTAIVWTRLTERKEPNPGSAPMAEFVTADRQGGGRRNVPAAVVYPEGKTVRDIRFAAPGIEGETRVLYKKTGAGSWNETEWNAVDAAADHTRQFKLNGLEPGTDYAIQVESRASGGGAGGQAVTGSFRTAPAPDAASKVVFVVTTGQAFDDRDGPQGYDAYAGMLTLDPGFFVHTGDIVYYDKLAKTADLAKWHWQRTYSLPSNVAFHREVGSYFIKDDHDAWTNDCWPTMNAPSMFEFTFEQGLRIFREQVPMGDSTYRTFRWGKDLQIWLVEGRDFRSPNTMPDGPGKTIWGEEQKAWFKKTVAESDATFRVLISPTPVVGPDRDSKHDNHSNKDFTHEGDEIRKFISEQKNMVVVCGDRHWQYMSVHPGTGVREYSCGPISDSHAGGWNKDDFRKDYHRFLAVKGGFLSGTVERAAGGPRLTFRYHAVDGSTRFEDVLRAE